MGAYSWIVILLLTSLVLLDMGFLNRQCVCVCVYVCDGRGDGGHDGHRYKADVFYTMTAKNVASLPLCNYNIITSVLADT